MFAFRRHPQGTFRKKVTSIVDSGNFLTLAALLEAMNVGATLFRELGKVKEKPSGA